MCIGTIFKGLFLELQWVYHGQEPHLFLLSTVCPLSNSMPAIRVTSLNIYGINDA